MTAPGPYELRPRLEAVASLVPRGCALVDIGTDHAGLPITLVQRGLIARAIAADVADVPCALARRKVDAAQLGRLIDVRQSDGWMAIGDGDANTATLCGMGGRLIGTLVTRDRPETLGIRTLVMQANKDVPALRDALAGLGWRPDQEAWVHDELAFVVMRWVWAPDALTPPPSALLLGEIQSAPPEIAQAWLRHELIWREARLNGLASNGRTDVELTEVVAMLRSCLSALL